MRLPQLFDAVEVRILLYQVVKKFEPRIAVIAFLFCEVKRHS